MDNNQNNPINPASPNVGNPGAVQPTAPVALTGANAGSQAATVQPGTPVDNLVQDITPASSAQPAVSAQPIQQATPVAAIQASAPAPISEPVQAQASAPAPTVAPVQAQNAQPYGAPKKSHAGLIIGVIVLLVLALAGVGGFLFYQQHEKTERVLADGLVKLLTAKELTANSVINMDYSYDVAEGTDLESVKITSVASYNENLEVSGNAKLEIKMIDYDAMNFEIEAMEGENALYFRLVDSGNISTVVSKLMEDEEISDVVNVKAVLESTFTSVGDSWYEIPYSKLNDSSDIKQQVDCARKKLSALKEGDGWNKIVELYQKDPFITVSENAKIESVNGYKKYPLTIDEKKSETFFDSLEDEEFVKDINSCVDDDSGSELNGSSDNYRGHNSVFDDLDDFEDDFDSDSDWNSGVVFDEDYTSETLVAPEPEDEEDKYEITLGIKPWSHEIVWMGITSESKDSFEGDVKTTGEVNLSYTSSVATPGDTKSIDDLMETLTKSIADSSKQAYYDEYCTKDANYSGYESEIECKEAVDEAFGDDASSTDIDDLLGDLVYSI